MDRRSFIRSAGIGMVLLSGCSSGNTTPTSQSPNESENDNSQTTETPIETSGVVGESVETEKLSITYEEVGTSDTYVQSERENGSLAGSQYVGYNVTIEAIGDTSTKIYMGDDEFVTSYLGHPTPSQVIENEYGETQIDGERLHSWADDVSIATDIYPGDSIEGGLLVSVPKDGFRPSDLVIELKQEELSELSVRGGDSDPRPPYSPPTPESGTYTFGNTVNIQGVETTVKEPLLSGKLLREFRDGERDNIDPPSDNAQFLALQFELMNSSPIKQEIHGPEKVLYSGEELNPVPWGPETYVFGDNEKRLAPLGERNPLTIDKTDGLYFYPDVILNSSIVYVVPSDFDDSKLEVKMTEDISFTSSS